MFLDAFHAAEILNTVVAANSPFARLIHEKGEILRKKTGNSLKSQHSLKRRAPAQSLAAHRQPTCLLPGRFWRTCPGYLVFFRSGAGREQKRSLRICARAREKERV